MPRFKGSCGCYNRDDARELGLSTAIVWNDVLDRAEHFDSQTIWYDQRSGGERLGIPYQTINRCLKKLEGEVDEKGNVIRKRRITVKGGYRPGTTIKTTWITIEDEWLSEHQKSQNETSKKSQNEISIYNDTKNETKNIEISNVNQQQEAPIDVVTVERMGYDSKGNWKKNKTFYTTVEEADKIEEAGENDYPEFGYWASRGLVGGDRGRKTMAGYKKTCFKLFYPEPDSENGGPKVKYQTDYCY